MQSWHAGRLSSRQADLVERWLIAPRVIADMSWDQRGTVVLDVDCPQGRVVIKAGGPTDHHIAREITAYRTVADALSRTGHAPRLRYRDNTAKLLVIDHLPGELAQGSAAEFAAATHHTAGRLLRTLHDVEHRLDPDWETAEVTKSLAWLDKPHRIAPRTESALRRILRDHRCRPVTVVPTHGDWQPRNWLVDSGTVRVIDFGRFAWRPAATDFCRLAAQQWRTESALESAFVNGYGADPREPDRWRILALHQAIGTAVWAHQVGDSDFERQGHRMLDDSLSAF
ncbi:phosphotransferase [Arthrobacter sp. SLBN-53]|uniref:phosphotransferase n=1 Tax=Arthrobacter sp. SLBN-53 TaxID=2768412 RepID=UPI00114D6E1D|nr:phosphotransferase [Arthrobacter sp. SLBN-53]